MTALARTTQSTTVIPEQHISELSFNVMPGRPVQERLLIREYRVEDRYAEAHFDREYASSMQNSPSHLIFLSALVHTQKLLYLALCREFGFHYDPDGPERFKIWPTKVEVRIPDVGADPRVSNRTDDRSDAARSACSCSIRAYMVGTPDSALTR